MTNETTQNTTKTPNFNSPTTHSKIPQATVDSRDLASISPFQGDVECPECTVTTLDSIETLSLNMVASRMQLRSVDPVSRITPEAPLRISCIDFLVPPFASTYNIITTMKTTSTVTFLRMEHPRRSRHLLPSFLPS